MKTEAAKPKPYAPSPKERDAISAIAEQLQDPSPRLKVQQKEGRLSVLTNHECDSLGTLVLMKETGTTQVEFMNGLLSQMANATCTGSPADETRLNFMLAVIKGIKPKDELEAMLAAQMAAVHDATMRLAGQLAQATDIILQQSAEVSLNRLARTFTTLVETLKRYRVNNEQNVAIGHLSISGGQTVVGNVTHARKIKEEGPRGSRSSLTYSDTASQCAPQGTRSPPVRVKRIVADGK